jgi:hypothetical protein
LLSIYKLQSDNWLRISASVACASGTAPTGRGRGKGRLSSIGHLQLRVERIAGSERSCLPNERERELSMNAPASPLIGNGERVPGNPRSNSHVVEPRLYGAKANFDVAQTHAPGELREGVNQPLIPACEAAGSAIAVVPGNRGLNRRMWNVLHDLREHRPAYVHCRPLEGEEEQHGSIDEQLQIVFAYRCFKSPCHNALQRWPVS